MPQLPAPQRAMMGFLARYMARHGYAPTVREIREGLGISSNSVVVYRLDRLQERGLVRRTPNRGRTLRIVGSREPWEAVS